MITVTVNSEFGSYKQKLNHGYKVNYHIECIDAYKEPDGKWMECPCCNLKPLVWAFNNGRSTACGCWNSRYDHFSVYAESIMSVHERTEGKAMNEYDHDALCKNWNEYCATMINPCSHHDLRIEEKW